MATSSKVCGIGDWGGPQPGDPDNTATLTATPEFGGINVSWTYPVVNPHAVAHTKLYRSSDSQYINAIELPIVGGNSYFDRIDGQHTYWYWIQFISIHGTIGVPIGPVSATSKARIEQIIEDLTGQIDAGVLANDLRTAVNNVSLNYNELRQLIADRVTDNDALAALIGDLDREVTQATGLIIDETNNRTTQLGALVTDIQAIGALANDSAALVMQESQTRADEHAALAQQMQTVAAATQSNAAAIASEAAARTSMDTAIAQQINSTSAAMNGQIASVRQELKADVTWTNGQVNAIGARWTAVVDVNGYVGGFGVYNNGSFVEAGFNVDRFWIGKTGVNKRKPFIVDGDTVYIDDAAIRSLTFSKMRDQSGNFIVGTDGKLKAQYIEVGAVGTNLLQDAAMMAGNNGTARRDGWVPQGWGFWQSHDVQSKTGINWPNFDWTPRNSNCFCMEQPNNWYNGTNINTYSQTIHSPRVSVIPGKRYEAHVMIANHRCTGRLLIEFRNNSEQGVGWAVADFSNTTEHPGGQSLAGWGHYGCFGVAPANAVTALVYVQKYMTKSGQANSYLWFTRPFFAEASATQTTFSPWNSGAGMGTRITPGGIETPNLSAITANLGNVSAGSLRGGAYGPSYQWPAAHAGGGFYLGPGGLLLGNANTPGSGFFQIEENGNFHAPGISNINGTLTVGALNVINTGNIVVGAVTANNVGEGNNSVSVGVTVDPGQVTYAIVLAEFRESNSYGSAFEANVGNEYKGERRHTLNGGNLVVWRSATSGTNIRNFPAGGNITTSQILTAGQHTFTAACSYSGVPQLNTTIRLNVLILKR